MKKNAICIITADKAESYPVAKYIQNARKKTIDGFRVWRGSIAGRTVVLITRAMGAENAQRALALCCQLTRPVLVVKFGAAGAVDRRLPIGEVVAPKILLKLPAIDFDSLNAGDKLQDIVIEQTSIAPPLVNLLQKLPLRIVPTSAETDTFICSTPIRNWLAEQLRVATVDMESFTVISHTKTLGIHAVSIQVVTDYSDEDAKETFKSTLESGTLEKASDVVIQFIKLLNESDFVLFKRIKPVAK